MLFKQSLKNTGSIFSLGSELSTVLFIYFYYIFLHYFIFSLDQTAKIHFYCLCLQYLYYTVNVLNYFIFPLGYTALINLYCFLKIVNKIYWKYIWYFFSDILYKSLRVQEVKTILFIKQTSTNYSKNIFRVFLK